MAKNKISIDKVGMFTSTACAIHCACMPILLILLPSFGGSFFASEFMEWGLFILSTIILIFASYFGYKKHNNDNIIIGFMGAWWFLFLGRLIHDNHHSMSILFLVVGGSLMAFSHYLNHEKCRCKLT